MQIALWLVLSLLLAHGEEGVGIDPFGRGTTGPHGADGGPGMDPNG